MQTSIVCTVLIISLVGGVSSSACTTPGRFPDAAVPACRGFIMCVAGVGDTLTQYNLTCPLDFVFDPKASACTDSAHYQCKTFDTRYVCNATGHFVDPFSDDCRSFVLCSEYIGGALVPRIMDCPVGYLFDAVEAMCLNETQYACGERVVSVGPAPASSSGYRLVVNVHVVAMLFLKLFFSNSAWNL